MLTNEMVFAVEGEKITSGGYNIDSVFLTNGVPVSYTLNKKTFGGLSVPSGLLYMSNNSKMTNELTMTGGTIEKTIDDGLYNKLFELAKVGGENKLNHVKSAPDTSESLKEDEDDLNAGDATEDTTEDTPEDMGEDTTEDSIENNIELKKSVKPTKSKQTLKNTKPQSFKKNKPKLKKSKKHKSKTKKLQF